MKNQRPTILLTRARTLRTREASQRFRTRRKRVHFQTQVLEIGHEQIAQRRMIVRVEGQVLPMLEAATRRDERQVGVVVAGGIAEV